MPHNEITRVQVPALMHLARLDYDFIPINSKENKPNLDTDTNILTESFTQAFNRLNPTKNAQDSLAEMKKRLKRKKIAISNAIKTPKTKFFITLCKFGSLAITCPMMKKTPIKVRFIALLIPPFSNALLKLIS
ncbi:hypothetical protein TH0950_07070 [Helicobacter pylori]